MTITIELLNEMINEYNAERYSQAISKMEKDGFEATVHGHTAFSLSNFINQIAEENKIFVYAYDKEETIWNTKTSTRETIRYKQLTL